MNYTEHNTLAIFQGDILLLLSDNDYTAKEFLEYASNEVTWKNVLKRPQLTRHNLQGADHTSPAKAPAIWL